MDVSALPAPIWRLLKIPRFLFRFGFGPPFVLLLTTIGRKTGRLRLTPLQYEEYKGQFYVSAARGRYCDWYQNILANANVIVQLKSPFRRFRGRAFPITNPKRIVDVLLLKLHYHPRMTRILLKGEGIADPYDRAALEQLANRITVIGIEKMK